MQTRRIVAVLAVLALLAVPSFAERFYYPSEDYALFSVDILNSWSVEVEDQVLHASPPDGSVYLGFWALDASDIDAASDAVEGIVGSMVRGFEVTEEGEGDLNGMPAYHIGGTGHDEDGGPINASVALFSPDGETFCIVIYFGSPEDQGRHESALSRIIASIRPE
jgi:hypothetical protein